MTQSHSTSAAAGTEHRVKPTALALHVASATSWGRPWRRRALSLPAPRALTFQGIPLPLQPLRSWLHLLSKAGMLRVRPPALNVLRRPEEDDEDAPTKIEDLGFELATDMILDFANFARQSRLNRADEAPGHEASEAEEPPAIVPNSEIDDLQPPAMAGSVSAEFVDLDFLGSQAPEAQASAEIPPEAAESSATLEAQAPVMEPQAASGADMPGIPVLAEPHVAAVEEVIQVRTESPDLSLLEAVAPVEPSLPASPEWVAAPRHPEEAVEPTEQEATHQPMPEREVPMVTTAIESNQEPVAEAMAVSPQEPADAAESTVPKAVIEEPVEPEQPTMPDVPDEVEAQAPLVVAESETSVEPTPEPVREAPKAVPPIVVSGVRISRKPVVRAQQSPAQPVDVPPAGEEGKPMVEAVVAQTLPELVEEPEAPAALAENTSFIAEAAEQAQPTLAEDRGQTEMESSVTAMHPESVDPDQQPERDSMGAQVLDPNPNAVDELGLEPMMASLEDALAVLAAANGVRDETPAAPVEPAVAASVAQTASAPVAAEVQEADDSTPGAAALQGILIQKETEMTEMRDESNGVDTQNTAPITSVELQEVAATLSVPQLDADPDDVLSDVQSTLNSLAGMAQGLTQQKQAAGRLQEELEEWNNQLHERERLAADKEERLQQLENHLKEAKTNLDRMAAENNRLLAERSEALKELAQTVDLRDRTTVKRAESIQLEQQRVDEQAANLRNRASELDERESALKRKSEELGVRLKQLQSAKDKFSAIVKSFNETVQFNSTLSAISKTVNE